MDNCILICGDPKLRNCVDNYELVQGDVLQSLTGKRLFIKKSGKVGIASNGENNAKAATQKTRHSPES